MPVERHEISVSQFCELLALEPQRFIGVTRPRADSSTLTILMEPEMQTSGTNPPLSDNTSTRKPKGKGKRGG